MTDIIVLCYHALSDDWPAGLAVRPADFERQVVFLLRRGYVPTTLSRAITAPPARLTFAITFDDAYRSIVQLAGPILQRLGAPATVYAPTAFIGEDEPMSWTGVDHWGSTVHRNELFPASWADLQALQADGWEIGSHTRTHPQLPELSDAALLAELTDSRQEIEDHLGTRCASLAYPYGAFDGRVAATVARAGYRTAVTLPVRFPLRPAPLLWPRVGVYRNDTPEYFERKVSRRHRAMQLWPGWARSIRARSRPGAPSAGEDTPPRP